MAPGTRTLHGQTMQEIYAGLPHNLSRELPVKTDDRLLAVFCPRPTAKPRSNTEPKSDEARHIACSMRAHGMEPKAQCSGRRSACIGYAFASDRKRRASVINHSNICQWSNFVASLPMLFRISNRNFPTSEIISLISFSEGVTPCCSPRWKKYCIRSLYDVTTLSEPTSDILNAFLRYS